MKKIALAAAVLALGTVSASAADMAARYSKAPVAAPIAIYNWTGFYVGLSGGGAWSDTRWQYFGAVNSNHDGSGWLAGGQVGYNWQAGSWVFGLEADGHWADINGSTLCPNRPLSAVRTLVRWLRSAAVSATPLDPCCSTEPVVPATRKPTTAQRLLVARTSSTTPTAGATRPVLASSGALLQTGAPRSNTCTMASTRTPRRSLLCRPPQPQISVWTSIRSRLVSTIALVARAPWSPGTELSGSSSLSKPRHRPGLFVAPCSRPPG